MPQLINFFPSFKTRSFSLGPRFRMHDCSTQLSVLILILSLLGHDSLFLAKTSSAALLLYLPYLFVVTPSTNLSSLTLKFKYQATSVSLPNLV